MIASLDIEQHDGGYLVRWFDDDENGEMKSRIVVSDAELLSFVASHFGIADRLVAFIRSRMDPPHGIRATVGTLTKATVEVVGEDEGRRP
jgi:hypothetical protein